MERAGTGTGCGALGAAGGSGRLPGAAVLGEVAWGRCCRRSGKEESGFRTQSRPGVSGWLLRKASSLGGIVLDFVEERSLNIPGL